MNSELLNQCFDQIKNELSPEQIEAIKKIEQKMSGRTSISNEEAVKIAKDLGIDILKIQKKYRQIQAENYIKNKKLKIGENKSCFCDSGKKYKKCCKFKS